MFSGRSTFGNIANWRNGQLLRRPSALSLLALLASTTSFQNVPLCRAFIAQSQRQITTNRRSFGPLKQRYTPPQNQITVTPKTALHAYGLNAELAQRMHEANTKMLEDRIRQPPNPSLTPPQFVRAILSALLHADDPLPDSGCRTLIRSSTPKWAGQILNSVGAPLDGRASEDMVASALGSALARPNNQFGILVGADDEDDDDERELCTVDEKDAGADNCGYVLLFPSDAVDYEDGSCWIECQFRDPRSNELLVVTGWQLKRRKTDGAWLIDRLDWQDFRDAYRPGIGREEWIRVFG